MRRVSDDVWQERREIVARFEESGLSLAEFARREDLAYWKLLSWRRRFAEESSPGESGADPVEEFPTPAFAEFVVAKPPFDAVAMRSEEALCGRPPLLVEVALPGGAVVRVYTGAGADLLRAAMEAARRC